MGRITFLVLSPPYTYQNTHTLIQLANAALKKGHSITGIFFFVDGVYNVKKSIIAEEGMIDIPRELIKLQEKGVKIAVCAACADYRGITVEDSIDNVEMAGMGVFSDFLEETDKLVVFGM
ncbi:MAG: DsrE/DsrF/TusD sulfur relay family protein [Promethearchaeota archaeon]